MHNLSIEQTPIHALKPQDRNARTHSKRQVRQIAASIRQFGFNNPILVDDNLDIIAGHGRVEAAKLLGQTTVPTVRLSHLSETDKRAYLIADNALATKAGWDSEILQGLIGFDVELTGFETPEIDLILEEWHEASGAIAPEYQAVECDSSPAISRLGDLWCLGPHRLLCGDARSIDAYSKLLGERKADLVFTDPPYNVRINGHVSGLGQVHHREFAIKDASKRSEIILDPFCGSGSTIIAAEKTGRHAYTIEIDPKYVDVAVRRWQKVTGKSAILEGTTATFEEIAEQRSALPSTSIAPLSPNVEAD